MAKSDRYVVGQRRCAHDCRLTCGQKFGVSGAQLRNLPGESGASPRRVARSGVRLGCRQALERWVTYFTKEEPFST